MSFTEQLLEHPFSMIVAGPSKAGKSVYTSKLLKFIDSMCTVPPTEIIWCYSEYQPNYQTMACEIPRLRFVQGLPDFKDLRNETSSARLMVLDDLMSECSKNKEVTNLFTKGVHHWNISLIFIVQNIFFSGMRTAQHALFDSF